MNSLMQTRDEIWAQILATSCIRRWMVIRSRSVSTIRRIRFLPGNHTLFDTQTTQTFLPKFFTYVPSVFITVSSGGVPNSGNTFCCEMGKRFFWIWSKRILRIRKTLSNIAAKSACFFWISFCREREYKEKMIGHSRRHLYDYSLSTIIS